MESPLATTTFEAAHPEALTNWLQGRRAEHSIVGATGALTPSLKAAIRESALAEPVFLDASTPLPIRNAYATPETLGPDRLAAAVGGWYAGGCTRPVLIIDSGTAVTFDFVRADGTFVGGNISANVALRLGALHDHTARLPLVECRAEDFGQLGDHVAPSSPEDLLGRSTAEALRNGALLAIRYETEGYMREFLLKYPNLLIIHTGGTEIVFENRLKNRTFAHQNLVLEGLNLIMRHILHTQAQ